MTDNVKSIRLNKSVPDLKPVHIKGISIYENIVLSKENLESIRQAYLDLIDKHKGDKSVGDKVKLRWEGKVHMLNEILTYMEIPVLS